MELVTKQITIKMLTKKTIILAQEVFNQKFPIPEIKFSGRMTKTAGMFTWKLIGMTETEHSLVYSTPIIRDNSLEDFENTVIHEVAHYIDYMIHGSTGHNARFYNIMRKLGSKNPSRCHSLTVRKNQTFSYQCQGCGGIIEMSKGRHGKMQRGTARYVHSQCRGQLKYLG